MAQLSQGRSHGQGDERSVSSIPSLGKVALIHPSCDSSFLFVVQRGAQVQGLVPYAMPAYLISLEYVAYEHRVSILVVYLCK